MTITKKNAVSLEQFLDVAKEKGVNQQLIERSSQYLTDKTIQNAIQDMAELSSKSVEEVASRQLSLYLDLSQDMPPLDIGLSYEG